MGPWERSVVEATGTAGTEAAGRVADVLVVFTAGPRTLGVSAIARELGLSKAVVHRILQALLTRGLVEPAPDSREYRLGPAAAALGARALRDSDLRSAGMPVIRALQQEVGETTTLSQRVPGGRVYLDQVECPHEVKMTVEVGRLFPLHAGSSSKCILAFLPAAEQRAILNGPLRTLAARTIVDADALREALRHIRRVGYATSQNERQVGAASVAAPVFDLDGQVVGAISIAAPAHRFDAAAAVRFTPYVVSAADRISRALGWRGGLPTVDGAALAGTHR